MTHPISDFKWVFAQVLLGINPAVILCRLCPKVNQSNQDDALFTIHRVTAVSMATSCLLWLTSNPCGTGSCQYLRLVTEPSFQFVNFTPSLGQTWYCNWLHWKPKLKKSFVADTIAIVTGWFLHGTSRKPVNICLFKPADLISYKLRYVPLLVCQPLFWPPSAWFFNTYCYFFLHVSTVCSFVFSNLNCSCRHVASLLQYASLSEK